MSCVYAQTAPGAPRSPKRGHVFEAVGAQLVEVEYALDEDEMAARFHRSREHVRETVWRKAGSAGAAQIQVTSIGVGALGEFAACRQDRSRSSLAHRRGG
jgi:hypothetical protein